LRRRSVWRLRMLSVSSVEVEIEVVDIVSEVVL
jgi:hypothetical protein